MTILSPRHDNLVIATGLGIPILQLSLPLLFPYPTIRQRLPWLELPTIVAWVYSVYAALEIETFQPKGRS